MRYLCRIAGLTLMALPAAAGIVQSQTTSDASRLEEVLPAPVASRIRALIAKARAHDLPSEALENRALKFAAKGVRPDAIEKSVAEQEARMEQVQDALSKARGTRPSGDEIEAGAEAVRKGLDAGKVAALAKSAPSGRSLAVPLYVIGSLVDRGLPSDSALRRVEDRLSARALDRDLEKMPNDVAGVPGARGNKPAETGRELAETKQPGSAAGAGKSGSAGGGPPAGVPANGGAKAKPSVPPGIAKKPTVPGKKP